MHTGSRQASAEMIEISGEDDLSNVNVKSLVSRARRGRADLFALSPPASPPPAPVPPAFSSATASEPLSDPLCTFAEVHRSLLLEFMRCRGPVAAHDTFGRWGQSRGENFEGCVVSLDFLHLTRYFLN